MLKEKINLFCNKFANIKTWMVALIFTVVGFALYANILRAPFIWDDQLLIVNNPLIQDWKYFPQYFTQYLFSGSGVSGDYWRPLQTINFSLIHGFFGLNPLFYHLANILWHITAAILAYVVLIKIFKHKQAAFFTSLVFLVHPLQTEAVTYISGIADSMMAILFLLSFLFFLKYEETSKKTALFSSILFFALSFLAKERAFLFFPIILLYLFTLSPKNYHWGWKNKIFVTLPFATLTVLYFTIRKFLLPVSIDGVSASNIGGFIATAKIFLKFIGTYIQLLAFPSALFMQRPVAVSSFLDTQIFIGLSFILISIIIFIFFFKKERAWAFGIGWFWFFFIFSFLSFMRMGFLMEHWLYLPMIGLLTPFFMLLLNKKNNFDFQIIGYILIILAVILFSVRTIVRNKDWQDPVRFYEKNIALGSHSAQIYNNLGMEYLNQGENERAVSLFNQSISIDNTLPGPWYNAATIYHDSGKIELAEKYYLTALERDPSGIPIYEGLQAIYNTEGRTDDAIQISEKGLAIEPNDSFMLANLGLLYQSKGNLEKAKLCLQEAIRLEPANKDYIEALKNIK